MSIGLILAADEPAIFYSSVETAEQWMEPIDVLNGTYKAAYGPAGEPYQIEADDKGVFLTRIADEPNRPDELKALLLRYFDAIGERVDPDEDLVVMLARCRPTYAGL